MSDFPRAQKIAALGLISSVVVITLIVLAVQGGGSGAEADSEPIDPNATPTVVPIMAQPRQSWDVISAGVRGAADTVPPVGCPFVDERSRDTTSFLSLTPAITFICTEQGTVATPIAPGRVVMRVTQPPLNNFKADLLADGNDGPWLRASAYGPFVVIDHGPMNGVSNVTSVYAGLDSIDANLRIGQLVDTDTPLGLLGVRQINGELVNGVLTFELLADDTRFGGDPLRQAPASVNESAELAADAAQAMELPVTTCNVPFGNPNLLVGAARDYRSGTHNGLDFNCGTNDHLIRSASSGQVIFVVDDYIDAATEDRDAVLAQAEPAFDTPFWTLANLYGNFVVIDHQLPSGRRAVTIYAHLSEVDPQIVTGVLVDGGTPLGRVGNSGTAAASEGITNNDGSVHLHWELHIDDRPIGYLEPPADTGPLYEGILCNPDRPSTTTGC